MNNTILIVDEMQQYLERQKEFLGYSKVNIMTSTNCIEAFKIVDEIRPNIIFIDMNILKMDGFEFCRAIRSNPSLIGKPIIVTTTHGESPDQQSSLLSYCDALIDKPQNIKHYLNISRQYVTDFERREKRRTCNIDAALNIEGITGKCTVIDISSEGAHIATDSNLLPDDIIRLKFVIPDGIKVDCYGRIICVYRHSSKSSKGFGVKFALVNSTVKEAITKYVEEA